MRRTEIQRGTKQLTRRQSLQASSSLSRSPVKGREVALRQRSKKRQRDERWYSALRFAFLRLDGEGRECAWPGCLALADTVQHQRGRVGADFLDTAFWLPSCNHHNLYAADHPAEAFACGFSLPRNTIRGEAS